MKADLGVRSVRLVSQGGRRGGLYSGRTNTGSSSGNPMAEGAIGPQYVLPKCKTTSHNSQSHEHGMRMRPNLPRTGPFFDFEANSQVGRWGGLYGGGTITVSRSSGSMADEAIGWITERIYSVKPEFSAG
jgi:hypothetical protein